MQLDPFGQMKPQGDESWYETPSDALARTCPFSPHAANEDEIAAERFGDAPHADGRIGLFRAAYVGHVEDQDFRAAGSSGGLVSWTASELMRVGLIDAVAHVAPRADPDGGALLFSYAVSRSQAALRAGAKSRYFPVELSAVLREIRETPGRYAVVGVPCFIKAVHLLRREDPILRERIAFTLGLFCGHMKSARMIESFAWQMGTDIDQVARADYRAKDPTRPANWYTARLELMDGEELRQDWWHFADGDWGSGFFQNSACDFCDDVVAETADISFGDAWVEPYSSDGRGTNVAVVRSAVVHDLIGKARAEGRLQLAEVGADFIHDTQAAGFRHRREGLALRLARRRASAGLMPRKRVAPVAPKLPPRRYAVYRLRGMISRWSHRMFRLARRTERPSLYIRWAAASLALYQGVTYSRGRVGAVVDRLEALSRSSRSSPNRSSS